MNKGRRFDDKIYKRNAWLWAWFDLPGGVWLTLYSGSMLAMWWIAFRYNLHHVASERIEIPTGITASYSVIVTAFAASNIARWYKDRQCSHSSTDSEESGTLPSSSD